MRSIRRPLVLLTTAFILGIVIYEFGQWAMVCALVLAVSALLAGPRRYRQAVAVMLIVGMIASLYTHVRWLERQHPLPPAIDEEVVTIEGTIVAPPEYRTDGYRFLLSANQIRSAGSVWSWVGMVQVTVARPLGARLPTPENTINVGGGDYVRISGSWRSYGGPRNPGEPDWSKVMARRGISGSLWSQQDDGIDVIGRGKSAWWQRWAWSIRERVIEAYHRYIPAPYDALLAGLTLGADDRIPEEVVSNFQSAGVLHLLAVSGGNVAFVVGLALVVLRRTPIPLWLENLLLITVIILFALVTGLEASVVRASWMAALLILARWILRRPEFISVVALTALVMLIMDPYACYAAGFQLSFAAIIGLAAWTKPFQSWLRSVPSPLRMPLAATLAAQLGVLPLSIYYFNQVSLIAPLANLVIVALVVPVNLMAAAVVIGNWGLAPLAWLIGQWTGWLLALMTTVAALAAKVPYATLTIPSIGVLGTSLLYLWLIWLSTPLLWLSPRHKAILNLAVTVGLIVYWWHPWPYPLRVTVLDVGQGDAIFMRMPNGKTVLVDGGGRRSPLPDTVGTGVVVPFLRRQGMQRLDLMVVSHPHEDHYRGLMAVTESMRVKTVVTGPGTYSVDESYQSWIRSLATTSQVMTATNGDLIKIDPRVSIEIMNPAWSDYEDSSESAVNNRSLVLWVRHGTTSLYLTGDIEEAGESQVIDLLRAQDDHTILKVGHHGSRTSTSDHLVEVVQPDLSVISVSERNNYGHPAAQTLTRLQLVGSQILRTDQQGAVSFTSNGNTWSVKTMR